MASEDARYRQSSQFRLWSFSPSQLAAAREKTNIQAQSSIAARIASTPNTSAPTSNANTPDPDGTPSLPDFLTPAEEAVMVSFYVSELLRAGDHAEVGEVVKATGAAFFRRFYVTNSIMTYPPHDMIIVALFFACKAEGIFPRIGEFISKFGRDRPEEILAGEYLLCQGIRFAFDVKHPFRALKGAAMELRRLGDIDEQRINNAERRAREILGFSPLITDAYFHYTPSQIMLAALSLADRVLAERLISHTFHYVAPPSDSGPGTPMATGDAPVSRRDVKVEDKEAIIGSHIRDKVLGTVLACRDMLAKELPERREHWGNKVVYKAQIQPIRKKLNKCRDPDRWNLVELQRARREQAGNRSDSEDDEPEENPRSLEKDAAVFGDALPAKRRKVVKTEDPFGPPL
ncbi:cyclin-like protein [Cercophora newfieldiana]|uniref:Cyclin-like protein n=1 Tax=Cercophora newfieldiana TaxID=92897 RepID=A0AA39YK20_9PEZI|nr:cyclin-like protein [Cercophora newfieldiana]